MTDGYELGTAKTQKQAETEVHVGPFSPLSGKSAKAYLYDTFNDSDDGWKTLPFIDNGNVGRSSLEESDIGSHGGVTGQYALCLPTEPSPGSSCRAVKRITAPWSALKPADSGTYPTQIRVECLFCIKSDPIGGDKYDVRQFGFDWDCQRGDQDSGERFGPMARYEYVDENDNEIQEWKINTGERDNPTFTTVGTQEYIWNEPLPGASPWRPSWGYFRMDFDFENLEYIDMQFNDTVFDLSQYSMTPKSPTSDDELEGLMNFIPRVQANHSTIALMYLDSLCISGEM